MFGVEVLAINAFLTAQAEQEEMVRIMAMPYEDQALALKLREERKAVERLAAKEREERSRHDEVIRKLNEIKWRQIIYRS